MAYDYALNNLDPAKRGVYWGQCIAREETAHVYNAMNIPNDCGAPKKTPVSTSQNAQRLGPHLSRLTAGSSAGMPMSMHGFPGTERFPTAHKTGPLITAAQTALHVGETVDGVAFPVRPGRSSFVEKKDDRRPRTGASEAGSRRSCSSSQRSDWRGDRTRREARDPLATSLHPKWVRQRAHDSHQGSFTAR